MSELAYATAGDLLRLLERRDICAVDLLTHQLDRIIQLNRTLNAVIQVDVERAMAEAETIDRHRAEGRPLPPLAGLPCTVKETFHVEGMLTTAGAPHLRNNRAGADAPAVRRLRALGAIVFGKTNVPAFTADWQTYNDIHGVTNNPWDTTRTPGGSSGGAAAALAAGLTPVELGSDLCGCLRIPAHYCGVFGHRASYGLISVRGHIPGDPKGLVEPDLAVAGPMARSAADLRMLMRGLADPWLEARRTPDFSSARLASAGSLRVLAWLDSPGRPIDVGMRRRYDKALDALARWPGVEIVRGQPEDFDHEELLGLCMQLTGRLMATAMGPLQRLSAAVSALGLRVFQPLLDLPQGVVDYQAAVARGEFGANAVDRMRADFCERVTGLFRRYDVLFTPVSPCAAFPHDHQPMGRRRLAVNGHPVSYNEHITWNALATVAGLPATVAPVGLEPGDLPCGIQIIAGHFRDDLTIDVAELLERSAGGFRTPPGYAGP